MLADTMLLSSDLPSHMPLGHKHTVECSLICSIPGVLSEKPDPVLLEWPCQRCCHDLDEDAFRSILLVHPVAIVVLPWVETQKEKEGICQGHAMRVSS